MAIFGRAFPSKPTILRGMVSTTSTPLSRTMYLIQNAIFGRRDGLLRHVLINRIIPFIPTPPVTASGGSWLVLARRRFRR